MRFGVLLALALLPWLFLTALEAYRSVNESRATMDERLDLIATNTVNEVGLILRAGRFGLEAAPRFVAEQGCEAGGERLLDRLGSFTALLAQDADETVICQVPTRLDSLQVVDGRDFDANGFRIAAGRLDEGKGDGVQDVVLLQSRIASTGEIYTLVLPPTLGLRKLLTATMGGEALISLNRADGSALLGRSAPADRARVIREMVERQSPAIYSTADDRRVVTQSFDDLGVFVSVGRQQSSRSSLIDPFMALLLPLLAWIIGFGLIWVGTQTMLITPLAKMRDVARRYADGRMQDRVSLSDSAAGEVRGLANTFNRMAGQLQDRDARIADNLDEKDTLLREIHHRVKNNLQIIISLLNMQERKVTSAEAVAAISETRARINAIAVVHRGLYESETLRSIDVPTFVSRLLSSLETSLNLNARGMRLIHGVKACTLTADSAIPVALFIVEAVGNAVDHGLTSGGEVHVTIAPNAQGEIVIEVSDNGRGVADTAAMTGIGTRLMQGFARQLGGELTYHDNAPGLRARLCIPMVSGMDEPFQVSRRA